MSWFVHAANWFALRGSGYQFWSGIGSGSPLLAVAGAWWHHHKCEDCWRPGHLHPQKGHPLCRKHRH